MQRSRELPIHMQRNGFDPVPELNAIRQRDGVVRSTSPFGLDTWVVTRYADVRQVLSDWESFSNVLPGSPESGEGQAVMRSAGNVLVVDPPEHTRLRRTVASEFTSRRLNRLEPRITRIVNDHLDALERSGSSGDLVASFSIPVPSLVICELLGVPFEDREDFLRYTNGFLNTSFSAEERMALHAESHAHLARLAARNRVDPGEGLLGRMVLEHGDELSDAEIVGMVSLLLLVGHETTSDMLSLGTFALLRHPDQLDRLRRDPEIIDAAIEELLRWLTIAHTSTTKVATRQVEIAGHVINSGDLVICSLPAANRDPVLVARPDELDITRPPSRHVAFGHGPHHCIGAPLARLQLRIALPVLLSRFPSLKLAAEPEFRSGHLTHGLKSLPIAW
ncbi:Cytochrome P450 [Saccharopolyspora antimicrobica]|uniref:Cytochrome P450 n=1 Tax=Saccharopolyspora antimicrobica TaxID=455193 RepID=A0A1I5CST1_9PSEU|nr:cytochrome P450 [Saccharopolyspora antimicrobica]RKT88757.1 cytochrome P450 [Saccharopolyspora antimicrobica]SFN90003.1 Cytochrome P450 [Saccharopolyspora antimicrobica]